MQPEADVRDIRAYLERLAEKYRIQREQLTPDSQEYRQAWMKELSYTSAAQALGWVLGEVPMLLPQEDLPRG